LKHVAIDTPVGDGATVFFAAGELTVPMELLFCGSVQGT
jgi:hypothetical protein